MLLKVYLVFFSCLLQDWAGQSMLNKPTENILKFNLVAFNLSLPWQLGPDSPAHPAGPGVNRDATRLLRQGLNSRVKSGPICSQINSEKKEGKKIQTVLQRMLSVCCLCLASHGGKHGSRMLWPFHSVSSCWWQKGGLHQCVPMCSHLFCFYFKSPGKYFFRACWGVLGTFL